MNINNVVTLIAALASILLGLIVFIRNPKKLAYILFGFFALLTSLWCLSNLVFYIQPTLLLLQSQYALGAGVLIFYIMWLRVFTKKKLEWYKLILLIIVCTTLFVVPFLPNLFITSLTVGSGSFEFGIGQLYNAYGIAVYIVFAFLFYSVASGYFHSRGLVKKQFAYMLTGSTIMVFITILFSFILPLFDIKIVAPVDAQSSLILVGLTAYSIVKHRLLDIRMVVARSVTYIMLLGALALIYAGSIWGIERALFPSELGNFNLMRGALRTVISVGMVFLFQPLRSWITTATDSVFFKDRYNIEAVLNKLSHTVSSTIVLVEMLYKVNDILINNMKLSRSAFVIFKNDSEPYTSQAIGYKGWPKVDVPDFMHMAKKGILVFDELEENSTYRRMLKKYDAAIMVPLIEEDELVGVYIAGEKNSGDMFNQQDLQVLEIMAPEVAIAVENAKAYEEISRFNVTLRQEVKRATRRLKDKNEELKALDKAKDEFISMASHQLRTPLTAIKGYLSMLLEGDAGEIRVSQYDFINEAYSAAGRMVGLINDLLNVSRMETGRFFLEPKEVDIERMVNEEVKQLQNHAREKGLYLKIEAKGKVPHIWADETKIRQVVMNFIDNAIYYTNTGGVTVKMKKDKDDFVFEVHDTGIGVPKEQMEHLFEKFFRADNARQTRPDGTGLGIYLAKRVVEDHGGRVVFRSEVGKGSVFGFYFPLKKVSPNLVSNPAPLKTAPALTSAAATFNEKTVGLEPPIATHPE